MDGQGAPAGCQASYGAANLAEQLMEAAEQSDGSTVQDQLSSAGSLESQHGGVQLTAPMGYYQPAEGQQLPGMEPAGGPGDSQALGAGPDGLQEPKRQICFDFTKNQCSRGAACKFSHDVGLIITVNSQEKGICFDFLKGLCTRGLLCRFSHDIRNLQTPQCTASSAKKRFAPICYDFVKNQCTRGEDCKYSHDYSSILYGPRAPGKDPYVICVDFTRGKCARGASCRYSHVDPRMLSNAAVSNPSMHPALLAAGLGAAAAAAVNQTTTMAGAGAMQGALAGLNAASMAAPARQPSDLQAQAALLLSGLSGIGAGIPSTPVTSGVGAGSIPASWNSLSQNTALQGPEGLAALLEQLQRTALTDSLAQLSPTTGDAASLSAFNALMGGNLSPTYAANLAAASDSFSAAAEMQRNAHLAAGLAGMLEQEQQRQLYQGAEAAALLQSHLSDASQLGGMPGSAPASGGPTPTAASAAMNPTVFQQRGPSPPTGPLDMLPPAPPAMPPKSQPLMPVYHPLLQHKGGALAGAGFRADILVDTTTGSPTIPASWGAAGSPHEAAQQLKQQAAASLPPPPPPVQVSMPHAAEQAAGTPRDMANSFDRMQLIWGQGSIWGQRQ